MFSADRQRLLIGAGILVGTFLWPWVTKVQGTPAVLWPSFVAVLLAFALRDIYVSLFLGAFAGAILLAHGNPVTGFVDLFSDHLIPVLADRWKISVIIFSLMMGGFVEVLNRNGCMVAIAHRLLGIGDCRRRAGLGAFFMGWIVFFDGLANCMLVGKTMRPITDRAGVSREKLAFIVDSTASPIAAVALISTWIATEMGLILAGFENVGDAALLAEISPYELLLRSLPFRFYNYFAICLVFCTIWMAREYGPMWECERRKQLRYQTEAFRGMDASKQMRAILVGLIPLGCLILCVFGGLYIQGGGLEGPLGMDQVIRAFGKADASEVFVCATAFASVVAIILSRCLLPEAAKESAVQVYFEGMKQMFLPMLILVLAFTLSHVIQELKTADYVVAWVRKGRFPVALLPAAIFLLASVMSFSTGTSWGTMGVLMPLSIPVVVNLTGLQAGVEPAAIVVASIGAVLAGAVFGDHCSPISDTTIVSAFASGCDTMDHVRTQLPYAVVAAGLSVGVGYLPAGFGLSGWVSIILGFIACVAFIKIYGRPTSDESEK